MPSTINRTLPAQNSPMLSNEMRQQFGRAADDIDALQTGKAALASPALTGTPTAPTAALTTNNTQLATTAFVRGQAITNLQGNPVAAGAPPAGQLLGWNGTTWQGVAPTAGGVPQELAFRPLPASGSLLNWIPDGTTGVFFAVVRGNSPLLDLPPVVNPTTSYFLLRGIGTPDAIILRAERFPWTYSGAPDEVFFRAKHRSDGYWYWYSGWQLETSRRWVTIHTYPMAQTVIPGNWTRIPAQQELVAAFPETYIPAYGGRLVIAANNFPQGLQISNYQQSNIWEPIHPNGYMAGSLLLNGSSQQGDPDRSYWYAEFINDWTYTRGPWWDYTGDLYWRAAQGDWTPFSIWMFIQQQVTRNPNASWW